MRSRRRRRRRRPATASSASPSGPRNHLKQYEQVAEQLRALVVGGELQPGSRLPNEEVLAREFGVSRATLREALRSLAAHDLIRTAKGAGGGSYVTLPSVERVSSFVHSSISLMADANEVSIENL